MLLNRALKNTRVDFQGTVKTMPHQLGQTRVEKIIISLTNYCSYNFEVLKFSGFSQLHLTIFFFFFFSFLVNLTLGTIYYGLKQKGELLGSI